MPQIVVRLLRDGNGTSARRRCSMGRKAQAGIPSCRSIGVVLVAWQERPLAAGSADSARRATLDKNESADYSMPSGDG